MRKITVHPVFIAFAICFIAAGKSLALINTVVCCAIHELGHVRAAATRGYRLNHMVFMPYGAMVTGGETIHKSDEAAISLWGPAVNFIFFAVIAALWWLFPTTYLYTRTLAYENLAIALFNLLPLYPLDMSRILLANAKHKTKMLKKLRIAGIVASATFLALFFISLTSQVNFTLLISAFMFLSGSLFGVKNEVKMYEFNTAYLKDYRHPIEKKFYRVPETLPLSRILRLMSPSAVITVEIVSANGKTVAELEEAELVDRISRAPSGATVGALLLKDGKTVSPKKTKPLS